MRINPCNNINPVIVIRLFVIRLFVIRLFAAVWIITTTTA